MFATRHDTIHDDLRFTKLSQRKMLGITLTLELNLLGMHLAGSCKVEI